jgi:hypothetical protein
MDAVGCHSLDWHHEASAALCRFFGIVGMADLV